MLAVPLVALGVGIAGGTPGNRHGRRVEPAGTGRAASDRVTVDPIPVDGYGTAGLGSVVTALQDYMRSRCVGAATVGISYQGIPLAEWGLGRTNGRAALPILDAECGDDSSDPYDASASNVDQHAELRVGSVSKSISAAVLRWALKERYHQLTGATLTDAALEAMPVLGDDFPGGLLPDDLRELLAGDTPLPAEITSCDELDGAADARWETVTLGHLLSHRAGLTRSSPSLESVVIPNLPVLRVWTRPKRSPPRTRPPGPVRPSDSVDAAARGTRWRRRPATSPSSGRRRTVDVLKAQAGRCLEFVDDGGNTFTVGDYSYSNTSPVFWGVVMEHVTGLAVLVRERRPCEPRRHPLATVLRVRARARLHGGQRCVPAARFDRRRASPWS